MGVMSDFGNGLYSGDVSFPFVQKRRIWFVIAALLVIGSVLVPFIRPVQFSIEFTGGSQFTVSNIAHPDQKVATDTILGVVPGSSPTVTTVGSGAVRAQTTQMTSAQTQAVTTALAKAFNVQVKDVASSFIGPTWGANVTRQSIWALVIFLALTFLILALYFRTWKMSAAAIIGLVDVAVITVGVYAAAGFQISPAAVIGFLTILAYSLYDTTVVFDQIRENLAEDAEHGHRADRTFGESVNLAVNQTLVRSINTTVIAILPVGAILFLGSFAFGAETLSDISLSIFVGIIVAAYSTLFVASPLYALFRQNEPQIRKQDAAVHKARVSAEAAVPA